jgi:hypothetical protein
MTVTAGVGTQAEAAVGTKQEVHTGSHTGSLLDTAFRTVSAGGRQS